MSKLVVWICIVASLSCLLTVEVLSLKSMTENAFIQEYLKGLEVNGYNRDVLPIGNGGPGTPVEVMCSFYLIDITDIDDSKLEYKATFYFRQSWNDSRLQFLERDINQVVLKDTKKLWTPDAFIVQEKEGLLHHLIAPNIFVRIYPNGEVLYSVKATVKISCPMHLQSYPHDIQKCTFNFESYGFSKDAIEYKWQPNTPIAATPKINSLIFDLKGIQEGEKVEKVSTGTYKVLTLSIRLQRKIGFYMTRLFIPFILLVVLSWISFWVPVKMIALRLPLLFVILYLMVNIGASIIGYIPPAPYTKASDVWIAVCETFVFAAFLEFVAVHVISKNKDKLEKSLRKNDPEAQAVLDSDAKASPVSNAASNSTVQTIARHLKRDVFVSNRIDKASRVLFPILFGIFNFIYWLVYCTAH